MSVILDALRRSRRAATRSGSADVHGALPHVPAGLGLAGASSPRVSRSSSTRPRFLGVGLVLVIGLGAWAAFRVSHSLMTNYAAPAQPSGSPNQSPNLARNQTPNQSP